MRIFFDSRSQLQLHRPFVGAAMVLLCIGAPAMADAPPSTEPAAASASSLVQIQAGIRQLGDDDPLVRDAAAQQLMGLHPSDLPALRSSAMSLSPLLPAQIAALHDIVMQVYLAPQSPGYTSGFGFLGLTWPEDSKTHDSRGVVVEKRIPGFVAYRMLRPDDVIIKLIDFPQVNLRDRIRFIEVVRDLAPGQKLRMEVVRGGKTIEVTAVLDLRPPDVGDDQLSFDAMLQHRQRAAEEYWKTNFSDIDRNSVTSTSP
jgi:hypothetical protein